MHVGKGEREGEQEREREGVSESLCKVTPVILHGVVSQERDGACVSHAGVLRKL